LRSNLRDHPYWRAAAHGSQSGNGVRQGPAACARVASRRGKGWVGRPLARSPLPRHGRRGRVSGRSVGGGVEPLRLARGRIRAETVPRLHGLAERMAHGSAARFEPEIRRGSVFPRARRWGGSHAGGGVRRRTGAGGSGAALVAGPAAQRQGAAVRSGDAPSPRTGGRGGGRGARQRVALAQARKPGPHRRPHAGAQLPVPPPGRRRRSVPGALP